MKIGIISGSSRQNKPQSSKVAHYIQHKLKENSLTTYLLDLSKISLKFWDESFWVDANAFDSNWATASAELLGCDAVIIVAPEWNGMIPPALLNVMHLAIRGELSNKPVLIVSVSAALNGVYPVVQLHASGKNSFANFIPHHVIVRNAGSVLNDINIAAGEEDTMIRERLDYSLKVLLIYAQAFIQIRNSEVIKNVPYAYGM